MCNNCVTLFTKVIILNHEIVFLFQYVQKKDPNFKEIKEDTVWSMEKFNDYFNEKVASKSGIEPDWVKNMLSVSYLPYMWIKNI